MSKTKRTDESDIAFIEALAELLNAQELNEIEVNREFGEDNELHVRLSKTASQPAVAVAPAVSAPQIQAVHAEVPHQSPSAAEGASSVAAPLASSKDPASNPGVVPSPMVGTVYLQPEPGAPAFISKGAEIKEGETLLIIEAMKTMNQIPAPRSGRIAEILVQDGDAVEFGAPLAIIE